MSGHDDLLGVVNGGKCDGWVFACDFRGKEFFAQGLLKLSESAGGPGKEHTDNVVQSMRGLPGSTLDGSGFPGVR